MPKHLGRITLRGKAAEKLMKSVGNTMSASITGEVESAAIDEDFELPPTNKKTGERPKVPTVHIDITGISGISNPAHKSLKKVFTGE